MSTKILKYILLTFSLLLIYLLDDFIGQEKRVLERQTKRLHNMQTLAEILSSKTDIPFLSDNRTSITVHCFDEIEDALKKQGIRIVQKHMQDPPQDESGFFQTQSFSYELRCQDLPSLHKFLYLLQVKSPYLYQVDMVEIRNLSLEGISMGGVETPGETSARASAPEYQAHMVVTVYFVNKLEK